MVKANFAHYTDRQILILLHKKQITQENFEQIMFARNNFNSKKELDYINLSCEIEY